MSAQPPGGGAAWLTPYLRAMEITRVPETKRTWFLRWVERFSADLPGRAHQDAGFEDLAPFISALESVPGVAEWQARQAETALKLLLGAVFGKRDPGRPPVPGGNRPPGGPVTSSEAAAAVERLALGPGGWHGGFVPPPHCSLTRARPLVYDPPPTMTARKPPLRRP